MSNRKTWSIICGLVLVSVILTGCAKESAVKTPESSGNGMQTDANMVSANEHESDFEGLPTQEDANPTRENADFRNAMWGEDKETVKKNESTEIRDANDEILLSEDRVGGYSAHVLYYFSPEGKLYEGGYLFSDEYTSAGQDINRFRTLQVSLEEKYGTPYEDEIVNYEKQSLIDTAGESKALEYGYVSYKVQWKTDTTNIALAMSAQDYEVVTILSYKDLNHKDDLSNSGL